MPADNSANDVSPGVTRPLRNIYTPLAVQHAGLGPYTGYEQTGLPAEDVELTHVVPGSPGGEYLRRFWHPVALASEVTDIPLALRVLGEDLVLFRSLDGGYGLLHRRCAHRGASLEYGKCEQRGLRCCYHGWLYAVDGELLEIPGEPPESPLPRKVRQGAYPVEVVAGIVFAYLGPAAHRPAFPVYDTFGVPGTKRVPYVFDYPCNWLQIVENAMDPVHAAFLHTRNHGPSFSAEWGQIGIEEYHAVDEGFYYTNARRVGDNVWVRIHHVIMPNMTQAGAVLSMDGKTTRYFGRPSFTRWVVPVDNENTRVVAWANFGHRSDAQREEWMTPRMIEIIEGAEPRTRPRAEALRRPGDYEAFVSQGRITRHAKEHLATSDKGVALFRRRLRGDIRALAAGTPPYRASDCVEAPIPTCAGDNVLRMPPVDGADDAALILEVSRAVARAVVSGNHLRGEARDSFVRAALVELEASHAPDREP